MLEFTCVLAIAVALVFIASLNNDEPPDGFA